MNLRKININNNYSVNFRREIKFNGYGKIKNNCGEILECFVYVKFDKIQKVILLTDGCLHVRQACSIITQIIEKKKIEGCLLVTVKYILSIIKNYPANYNKNSLYQALLSLKLALRDYAIKNWGSCVKRLIL